MTTMATSRRATIETRTGAALHTTLAAGRAGALRALLVLAGALAVAGPAQAQPRGRGRDPAPAGGAAKAATATLVLEDGRRMAGVEVREEKFAKVKFRDRGRMDEVDGERVVEIRYDDPPPAFVSGLSQLRAGLYERAAASFTAARNQGADGSWVKLHATYYLGEAQRGAGAHTEAVAEYRRLLDQAADHWLAPAAHFGLGQALAAAGKASDAVSAFKKLDQGFGDRWRLQGKLGEADALLAQGQPGPARGAYEIAQQGASRFPAVRQAAQVGIGKCYVADKRYDDAVRFFEGIISQTGLEPEVAGGAWLGIGDCRAAQAAENGDDANRLKEALIAYQTAVVRYAGVLSVYPKALYMSHEVLKKLGKPELAARMADELRGRFPKNPWTDRLGKGS